MLIRDMLRSQVCPVLVCFVSGSFFGLNVLKCTNSFEHGRLERLQISDDLVFFETVSQAHPINRMTDSNNQFIEILNGQLGEIFGAILKE